MWLWWVIIPIEDLADVTLAIEDTDDHDDHNEDEDDKGYLVFNVI